MCHVKPSPFPQEVLEVAIEAVSESPPRGVKHAIRLTPINDRWFCTSFTYPLSTHFSLRPVPPLRMVTGQE